MRLYDYLSSGNSYKVRLLLNQLGESYERVELDIDQGKTRTPEFLRKNPNGKIPALELDNGVVLAESNAILVYLADDSEFMPTQRLAKAQALQWMFFEQYSHEPAIAVSRYIRHHLPVESPRYAELPALEQRGYAALDVMEKHLSGADFMADGRYSIADISLYAYTHVATEGGFDLDRYRAISEWLQRCRAQPRYISIDYTGNALP